MMSKLITILLISAILVGTTVALNQPTFPELPEKLALQRIDGTKQVLQDLNGKPLLVTFWSPSCLPCLQEVSHLNQLYIVSHFLPLNSFNIFILYFLFFIYFF